jgi:hypothetical protein
VRWRWSGRGFEQRGFEKPWVQNISKNLGIGNYFGGSLDFDDMDLENDDADLDIESSGEFVIAM